MAGRHIKPPKGTNDLYDAGRGHVYAEKIQPLPDNMKKKISVILEAIPTKSKSEIAEVLQACDYDVDSALNCFIADGEMEAQNEWMVQGKRKNKKKKKNAKKALKEESQNETENAESGSKTEKQADEGQQKNIPNGTVPKGHTASGDKPITSNTPKPIENAKPTSIDDPNPTTNNSLKPIVVNDQKLTANSDPQPASPPPHSPPLLSPTDSVSSSQGSQSFNKARAGSSSNEKHPRVRTSSTSKPEVIKKSLKDLERSAVSIARFQAMLDEHADSSTKALSKSFQEIRQALDERERILGEQLQSVIEESKKLLENRQEDAACLKFKCNRVGCMNEEESAELRNEIKHFVGERRIDEDLGKTTRFKSEQEKMLEAVKTFGEVPSIRNHYTPFKRKQPEPAKLHKPPPVKSHKPTPTTKPSTPPTNGPPPTTTTAGSTKSKPSSETKAGNSGNEKPPLSPTRLKDQAAMHARLQQAMKEQQVPPATKEASKKREVKVNEKPRTKEFGPKPFRSNSGRGQQGNSQREQNTQRQRQVNSAQHTTRSFSNNRHENKTPPAGENSKEETRTQTDRANSHGDGSPADNATRTPDIEPADGGTLAREGSLEENNAQIREGNNAQAEEHKPAENEASHTTTHDLNSRVFTNQGHKKPKRRYIRKTPINNDGPFFRNGTSETSNGSGTTKGNGDHNEKGKGTDLPNGEFKGETTNGFVPLPQRNNRPRKFYCKKEPGSKIEFPPKRENGDS
ncbi:spermatogenesis-associated serine-rich protein 2-like [Dendronephthya gigantea]|uniref:spermatogenesis-associated serine-rich protein 2-like n=1 Tax=Dendronephthya gigantea TaxID=151771 RepID=UPI00106B24E0|nr:spermatogenesis-associated serine-rich protein 2-like [Dendronephthya gigantea]